MPVYLPVIARAGKGQGHLGVTSLEVDTHRRAYIAHGFKNTRRTQNHTRMSSHNVPIHPLRDIEGDHHHLSGEWAPLATATGTMTGTHRHL